MRRSWGDGSQLLATPLSSFFFFCILCEASHRKEAQCHARLDARRKEAVVPSSASCTSSVRDLASRGWGI
jgi:hypothetical protein